MGLNGDAIRVIRAWKGYSQRELARRAGVSHTLVSYIESGIRKISPEVESKIREVLDLDMDTINLVLKYHNEIAAKIKCSGGDH